MSDYCIFDQLPVELLEILFSYFMGHEVVLIFSDISDYINAVLRSYSTYRIDFQSIRKSQFEFICHRIQPEQVISLSLSR